MKSQRPFLLLLLLLSMLVSTGIAQPRFRKPLKEPKAPSTKFGKYHLGVKLGCPWNVLTKSDITPVYLGHFGYAFGLSAERHFNSLSVGLEVQWARRGTRLMGQTLFQTSLDSLDTFRFETRIKYDVITLRIPLTWYIMPPASHIATPYVFMAPGIERSLPIRLNLPADSLKAFLEMPFTSPSVQYTTSMETEANETPWNPPFLDLTLTAGTGVLIALPSKPLPLAIKFDVGVRFGLLNLASDALKKDGVAIRNCGIEAGLTLFFGIDPPLRDACYYFQKKTVF